MQKSKLFKFVRTIAAQIDACGSIAATQVFADEALTTADAGECQASCRL